MSIIRDLLQNAVERGASDIHLKVGKEPVFRVHGAIETSRFDVLSAEDLEQIVTDILPPQLAETFRLSNEADFSHNEETVGRFRVNLFRAQRTAAIAMRHVRIDIPTVTDLNLPPQLERLAHLERGIVLMAGTTGSGKSTTLAALIQTINRTRRRRIITVEDPIEYMFIDDQSIITQREVGLDTASYEVSLKHLMRQDPDVIMIGEMRDATSIMTALIASETGHLVFSTIHASSAAQAVPRMLDVFPATERDKIRLALAENLQAVVCQRLIGSVQGGVVPAAEIMINTSTVRKLLVKNQLDVLSAAIEKGTEDGMQSFNQSVYKLVKSGRITEADGMAAATNPESLRMNLQGIFLDEGRSILGG
jgi:twitching motility protein PilT